MFEHEDLSFTLRRLPPPLFKHTCSLSTRGAETDPQGLLTRQPHLISKPPVLVRDLALEGSKEGSPGDSS